MPNIKNNIKNLRTKISNLMPKTLSFSKYLFIGLLSGLAWSLHFIGVAAELTYEIIKSYKNKIKGEDNGSK